jgi:hypothetical protein
MNPELRRNFWLELTTHRLVAMPGVLILLFGLFIATDASHWAPILFSTATAIFILLVHLWGVRQSSESVTEEVRDRTWDWQRLSALGPWQIAWGKLAGATAFTWYGAAICLVAMAVAAAGGAGRENAGWLAVAMVASGVALHGGLLAASLQAARKDSRLGYRLGTLMLLPAMLVAGAFIFMASRSDMGTVTWHGAPYETLRFIAVSSVAFALWGVLGAYRQMCSELRVRTLPWAWPAFAIFVAAYLAGFAPRQLDPTAVFILTAVFTAIALSYYALFAEDIRAMKLRRVVADIQARQWRRAVEEAPVLLTTLALAILMAALAPWAVANLPLGSRFPVIAAYPIASVLFLMRDVGLLVFFSLGRKPKRVEGVTLLYIVLLSWVIPGLLRGVGLGALAMAIMPIGRMDGWQAALVLAAHVVIVWAAVAWRWRRAFVAARKV